MSFLNFVYDTSFTSSTLVLTFYHSVSTGPNPIRACRTRLNSVFDVPIEEETVYSVHFVKLTVRQSDSIENKNYRAGRAGHFEM